MPLPRRAPAAARPARARLPITTAGLLAVTAALAGTAAAQDDAGIAGARSAGNAEPSYTQTPALDPVVVSATRTETPVSELSRSVTVIDRAELDKQTAVDRNLSGVLGREVPGFSPSTEALTNFGQTLRGRNFLTTIDGIPQSTPLRSASRDLNTIDPDQIQRIEVIRGGTAAYGFGATGGLVNIITRRPEEGAFNAHSDVGLTFSTQHPDDSFEWRTNQRVSGRQGQVDYLLSGTFVTRNDRFDAEGDRIPPDPLGVQGGFADSDSYDVLGKVGYSFDDETQRIELTANHFSQEQDTPWTGLANSAPPYGTGRPARDIKTRAVRGNPNVENPGTEKTTLALGYTNEELAGSKLDTKAYYNDSTATFAKFPGITQSEIRSEKAGARSTVETPVDLGGVPVTAIWGADYLYDETVQVGLDGPTTVPVMTQNAIAGFGELEVPVSDVGLIRGGVRHEEIFLDVGGVTNSNGIAVEGGDLRFSENLFNLTGVAFVTDNTELFGGYSQGFSVADIGRAIRDGTATEAEQLESEAQKVDNYELGVRTRQGRFSGSLTGFFSESENGTTFDRDLNIAKTPERIWGVEASADMRVHDRLTLGGSVTWQQGVVDLDNDGDYEEDLPSTRVPPVKVTSYVEYAVYDWWNARLQGLYSGHRAPDSSRYGAGDVDAYALADFYSSFDTGYGQIQLAVENLFNADYFPVVSQASATTYGFVKGPGRTVSLSYSVEW